MGIALEAVEIDNHLLSSVWSVSARHVNDLYKLIQQSMSLGSGSFAASVSKLRRIIAMEKPEDARRTPPLNY